MSAPVQDLLQVFAERGHAPTCTDVAGLQRAAAKGLITGYIGFDATADSLHIGNMTQLMLLRRLQQCGHKPIVLMGGATTLVGDPSGKDDTRPLITLDSVKTNIASIKTGLSRLLRFGDGANDALLLDNADWLTGKGYIDMLREVGPHFTINRMLTMDSVKLRLEREQPLTFLEFNYMIMQGYDFMHLRAHYNCVLQMGGSDQWGNIVQGIELGRRMKGYELFGITQPLLTTSSGAKMGKSVDGAVWINANRKHPYDFWQYWRNCEDADVGRWLRLFTDLPLPEIARLEALQDREINEAKKALANEVTTLVHGPEAAAAAAKTAQDAFEKGTLGGDIPVIAVSAAAPVSVLQVITSAGFAESNSAARRLAEGNGFRIDGQIYTDVTVRIEPTPTDLKISKGKKDHAILRFVADK